MVAKAEVPMIVEEQINLQRSIQFLQRTNELAATTDSALILTQTLELVVELTKARSGIIFLTDFSGAELIVKAIVGYPPLPYLLETKIPLDQHSPLGQAINLKKPILLTQRGTFAPWEHVKQRENQFSAQTTYCFPLLVGPKSLGVVQVFDCLPLLPEAKPEFTLAQVLVNRMATEIEKTQLLAEAQRREHRQQVLLDIIARMTTTLDRNALLRDIMRSAQDLLDVEAVSIWLKQRDDDGREQLVLHLCVGHHCANLREVAVDLDKGIIGQAIRTGETIVVNDVRNNRHFYGEIDQQSGFTTHSILCIPMWAPKIQLGGERGELQKTIIGGAQALNKHDKIPFSDEDVRLFKILVSQAATALQLSQYYNDTYTLFWGIIDAITGAIDLRDPYTLGHSQRVSEFSVALAQEMGLPQEMIYHIRIGSKLHDVGKIGVRDQILRKPGPLTEAEMEEMREHASKGAELLRAAGLSKLLQQELRALEEHHECLDGLGYPNGLKGFLEENENGISLIGRIVAVADIFDALTSDRPYQAARTVEQALQIIRNAAGTKLDPLCVEALIRAREKGVPLVRVQAERRELEPT